MSVVQLEIPSDGAAPNTLFGYEILGGLARGAGSVLYYAQLPGSDVIHVLKHVAIHTPKDKRYYEQLRTEFLLGRHLNHPGLRRSLEMKLRRNWTGGVIEAALILELCDGYTLEEFVPPNTTEQICVFIRAAMAVAALHDFGYIHCDLKPGNILVRENARATVIDLGQACKIGSAKLRIQGTPNFMAPEQTRREPLDEQTDVFCFGATMYNALTGQPLTTVMNSGKGSRHQVDDDKIPFPHHLAQGIPLDLSQLIMDCVKTRREDRLADMNIVVERLRDSGLASVSRLEDPEHALDFSDPASPGAPTQPQRPMRPPANPGLGLRPASTSASQSNQSVDLPFADEGELSELSELGDLSDVPPEDPFSHE